MKRLFAVFRLFQNMGLRYVAFRSMYELQKRTGLLKRRFPTAPPPLPKGTLPSLTAWRAQQKPFFSSVKNQERFPLSATDLDALRRRVEAFYQNRFLFFGAIWYTVPDWLTNPDTGYRYSTTQHWTQIPDLSPQAGDIKYVWEKARFTFLYDLIRYDHHTGEDQSETALAAIESWIDTNPVNRGPHWRCSQEITLRVLNWTFALHYYQSTPALTEARLTRILTSIYHQMQHVAANIHFSRIAVRNNHALTETLGLYLVGTLYPFFPESTLWKQRGKRWFEQEIAYQIYEDGTFLQFSMNYHRVVVQLFSWALPLAHLHGDRWAEVVYERARRSLRFLRACQDSTTGWLPNYGHNDGALFFPLTECTFRDYRPQLLALARALGEPLNYGPGPWQEEAFWLSGGTLASTSSTSSSEPDSGMYSFEKGGYYVLKDLSTLTFLRCGSYRDRPFQADNLHLDLWVDGENILRDAGTYKYNTDERWLRYFGGTASHNTVGLGDYDQMRKGHRFIWYDWVQKANGTWIRDETTGTLTFEGTFEGFRQLGTGIVHRRRVTKVPGQPHWIVEDWLHNAPPHLPMQQHWHPSEHFFEKYLFQTFTQHGQVLSPQESEGWYSECYGQKVPTRQLTFTTTERYLRTEIRRKS